MRRTWLAALVVLVLGSSAWAEDVYVSVPLEKVTLTSGKLPAATGAEVPSWRLQGKFESMRPTASIDGKGGEAYVAVDRVGFPYYNPLGLLTGAVLRVHLVDGAAATGRMVLPKPDWSGMDVVTFKVAAENNVKDGDKDAKALFLAAKADYYESLVKRQVAGTAYFRHLAEQASSALPEEQRAELMQRGSGNLEDMYSMFTGGKAVAESLQLDRVFRRAGKAQERTVDVSTIEGITVKAFDWKERVKDLKNVEVDPLAALIPHDQHAIFFSSFEAMTTLTEEADANSLPVLQYAQPRSEDGLTKERYQKQLGLDMSALGKLLGPAMIKSVAVTGSDPYLRMGSDVAVLFEPRGDVEALRALLTAQVIKNTSGGPKVEMGKASGELNCSTFRSADRTVCSCVAVIGSAVVVSNSPTQLAAINAVFKKKSEALADLPEYLYFRDRYRRADGEETAFVILTDATIRRWSSPKVRIADARRLQAAAILADREAAEIAGDKGQARVPALDMGQVDMEGGRATSSIYGTLDFMTPISELDMAKVTPDEAEAYKAWRDNYQTYYRRYFDPIAIRLSVQKTRIAADVTVMPLIEGSAYKDSVGKLTGDATFGARAGDPHETLAQVVVGLDPKGELFRMGSGMLDFGLPNPFSWIGDSASAYIEQDPIWAELAKAEDPSGAMEKVYTKLPLALRLESKDGVKLALFVAAARRYIEKSAPNTVTFETVTYKDYSYVKITPKQEGPAAETGLNVYYVTLPDSLLVTINEGLLKRALDRAAAGAGAAGGAATQPGKVVSKPAVPEWLGRSAAVHIERGALEILFGTMRDEQQAMLQNLAWSNLPILNELKRLHPDEDAPVLYGKLFHGRLLEPAGGQYVWNKDGQTYESTVLGSPVTPKAGAALPAFLPSLLSADFGLTFEPDGLRAKAQITRKAATVP